jgi:hypothetical protein
MSGAALSRHILELATEPGGVESFSVKEWAWVSLSYPSSSRSPKFYFMILGRLRFPLLSMFDLTHVPCGFPFFFLPLSCSGMVSFFLSFFFVEVALRDNERYVYSENQRIKILKQSVPSIYVVVCYA